MKNLKKNITKTCLILLLLPSIQAKAQTEPMFTQYMYNETAINPAYAGSREYVSMTMAYRNQWVGINGAPKTETFTIHAPTASGKVGLGFSVLNESIGVTHQTNAFAAYAYRIQMENSIISFGLQGGATVQQENLSEVVTAHEGDVQFMNNTPTVVLPNAGFGMYFKNEKFYAGVSIPRLLAHKIAATSDKIISTTGSMHSWHYFITAGYVQELKSGIKIKPTIMVKAVEGAPVQMDLNMNAFIADFMWIGIGYRTGDAITTNIQFQLSKNLRIGYSYDYTTTELSNFTSGSHEFNLGYDFGTALNKIVTPRYF